MTFKKGQSGNPTGRPRSVLGHRERATRFMSEEGWESLVGIARGPHRDQMRALELVAAYAYGKPTQPVSGDDDASGLRVTVSFDHASDSD